MTSVCWHCGDSIPVGIDATVTIDGVERAMCCHGCAAAAAFIAGAGLGAFYRHRSAPTSAALRPADVSFARLDGEQRQRRYVHRTGDGLAEVTIAVDGLYCAACGWLVTSVLERHPAVLSVSLNPATSRLVLSWRDSQATLSELLGAIAALGFRPEPSVYGETSDSVRQEYRRSLQRLLVAAAAGMQVMMFAVALYAGAFSGIDDAMARFLRGVSLLVATPVVFYSARPFFAGAWRGLTRGRAGMDLPVALAIAIAYGASLVATLRGHGEVYFDSVVMFVLLLSIARFVEMRSRHRVDSHLAALAATLPDDVTRIGPLGPEVVELESLRSGDRIRITPGDVVAADGIVIDGMLELDESVLTGESRPVERRIGETAIAGAMNRGGVATLAVTAVGATTRLAEIARLIEAAQADRPPLVEVADRIAGYFVAGVLALALAVGVFWWLAEPARALPIVLATLVVTCPCALALATPAALASATTRLARHGVLLIRSRVLGVLAAPVAFVFDKTGTLTAGQPSVRDIRLLSDAFDRERVLTLAAALEAESEHVLARAFEPWLDGSMSVSGRRTVRGAGVEAEIDGIRYRIGKRAFVSAISSGLPPAPDDGSTSVYLAAAGTGPIALLSIGDALRPDAARSVAALRAAGHRVWIASGDRAAAVAPVAAELGIDHWRADLTPEAKVALVRELRDTGTRVVMVGDGINDAPVLAAADGSIAMEAGTALARASADAIVPGTRLSLVADLADVARATRRVIAQNLMWALGYNIAAVPLAASGLVAPWMAAVGMSLSSLLVVANATRLKRRPLTGLRPGAAALEAQIA